MKRSHISDSTAMETYRRLLAEQAQQDKDAEILQSKREDTALALRSMPKDIILQNMGLISPFRSRFLQKLGTIVDFLPKDWAILIKEKKKATGGFLCVMSDTDGDGEPMLKIAAMSTAELFNHDHVSKIKEAYQEDMPHLYFVWQGTWRCEDKYANNDDCDCHKDGSEFDALRKFICKHGLCVLALIEELVRIHTVFQKTPQKMLHDIERATEIQAKKRKNK